MPPRTILVVEDERPLAETLRFNLERDGYRVTLAHDGREGLHLAQALHPDLILLDIMLPGLSGTDVLARVRDASDVPVLLLTARTGEADRVHGLDLGADDYITKPFSVAELLARVRAHLRRHPTADAGAGPDTISFGEFTLDRRRRELRRGDRPIPLRPKEYDLLDYLARRPGVAVSRDQILNDVWSVDYDGGGRTVDVHIRWLRRKIESPDAPLRHLITVRGVGYRFER